MLVNVTIFEKIDWIANNSKVSLIEIYDSASILSSSICKHTVLYYYSW